MEKYQQNFTILRKQFEDCQQFPELAQGRIVLERTDSLTATYVVLLFQVLLLLTRCKPQASLKVEG